MFWYELLIVVCVLALDLGTKYGIVSALGVREHVQTKGDITFIKDFISFSYTENTGATFGAFQGRTGALTAITAIGLILIFVYLCFSKKESKFLRTCLVLILAGGLGNLYDRIVFGYVRDFINFDFWPTFATFNIADSFLTVSTILVVIYAIFIMPKEIMNQQKQQQIADTTFPPAYAYNALTGEEIKPVEDASADAVAVEVSEDGDGRL